MANLGRSFDGCLQLLLVDHFVRFSLGLSRLVGAIIQRG